MKKIYYILSFFALFTSCDVLNTEPLDSYNELVVWRDKGLAENVLRESYWSTLKRLYCSGDNSTECLRTEAWTDNIWTKDNNSVASEGISPTNVTSVVGGYDQYDLIRKANLIINNLTNNSNIEESACRQFIAEARCLRVMVYDWMARRWGGLMLVDELMSPEDDMLLPRATEEETYRFLVEDLKKAIPDLPLTAYKERFTRGAALTLLTRVALDGGLYDEVIAAGKQLFENGEQTSLWSIDPEYRKMFGSYSYPLESKEVQLVFTLGDKKQYCEDILPMYIAGTMSPGRNTKGPDFNEKVDAWCANWPSHELAESYLAIDIDGDGTAKPYTETARWKNAPVKRASIMYSNRDARMDATICRDSTNYFTSPVVLNMEGNCYWDNTQNHPFMSQSGYMWRKYIYELDGTLPGYQILYDFRYILLRLGEASLNYAEALGRKGQIKDAVAYLNKTRVLHGKLPALSDAVSVTEFWANYKIERRAELALEGDRYFSVIRWAKAENATKVPEFNSRTHCVIIEGLKKDNSNVGTAGTFTTTDLPHGGSSGSDKVFSWPKRMYFPIPESEVISNTNIKQNPQW